MDGELVSRTCMTRSDKVGERNVRFFNGREVGGIEHAWKRSRDGSRNEDGPEQG